MATAEECARVGQALAHPLRVRIVEAMRDRPFSATSFARTGKELSLSTVAYHFRVLDELGLLHLVERLQRRGAQERCYKLSDTGKTIQQLIANILTPTG